MSKKIQRRETKYTVALEDQKDCILLRRRFSNLYIASFAFAVVSTFGMIYLDGIGHVRIDRVVMYTLLTNLMAHIASMLMGIGKFLFSQKLQ